MGYHNELIFCEAWGYDKGSPTDLNTPDNYEVVSVAPIGDITIQEEIRVSQEFVDETIEHYKSMPDKFGMGILETVLDKKGIIKAIEELTEVGKALLLMRYKFKKRWDNEMKDKLK